MKRAAQRPQAACVDYCVVIPSPNLVHHRVPIIKSTQSLQCEHQG
jgi:hypothetical protein